MRDSNTSMQREHATEYKPGVDRDTRPARARMPCASARACAQRRAGAPGRSRRPVQHVAGAGALPGPDLRSGALRHLPSPAPLSVSALRPPASQYRPPFFAGIVISARRSIPHNYGSGTHRLRGMLRMHGMLRIRGIRGMLRMRSVLHICGMRTWWTSIPSVNMASLPRRLRPRVRMRAAAAATQAWGACAGETVGVRPKFREMNALAALVKGKRGDRCQKETDFPGPHLNQLSVWTICRRS
jgi:hypothetical protein